MGTIAHSLVTMIFCVGALAVADGALAVLVPGKKLLIKIDPGGDSAKNKLVFLVKSPDVQGPATASRDPTVGGGTFRITGPGVTQFGLAAADWKVNAAGTVFKYKGSFCRAKLKPGVLLRAACHGPFGLPGAVGPIDLNFATGTSNLRHCARFDVAPPASCTLVKDGSDGIKYLSKNCEGPPTECVPPPF